MKKPTQSHSDKVKAINSTQTVFCVDAGLITHFGQRRRHTRTLSLLLGLGIRGASLKITNVQGLQPTDSPQGAYPAGVLAPRGVRGGGLLPGTLPVTTR